MTKKELIINTALRLFSENGFDTTPTSLIAKEAGVSEGLIFRHFENKDGLLQAILSLGDERIAPFIEEILNESDPRQQIHKVILMPFTLFQHEKEFWKLQFSIKWQKKYKKTYIPSPNFQRLYEAGVKAFETLGYPDPQMEVAYLSLLIEGLNQQIINSSNDDDTQLAMLNYIKSKY